MKKLFWSFSTVMLFSMATVAQEACPVIVETALSNVAEACAETGRNQACYGNVAITAQGRVADFSFEQVGDITNVNDIETLTLAPLSEGSDEWGIALLKLQANLPNTLPGENVTVLAFGDVALQNAVLPVTELTVSTTANGRARTSASSADNQNVIMAVPSGTTLKAIARTESNDWVFAELPENDRDVAGGWLSTQVITINGDIGLLPVADGSISPALLNPMQAFYLRTGVGDSPCAEVPPSGIVVQTPEGRASLELVVNGVEINLGSTAFLQTRGGALQIALLEGKARVTAQGTDQFLPAGTFVEVPLDETGRAPIAPPSAPQPYDDALFATLPVSITLPTAPANQAIITPIEIAPAIPEAQIPQAINDTYTNNGLVPGWYRISVISFTRTKPEGYSNGYCFSEGTVLQWYQVRGGNDTFGTNNNPPNIVSITEFTFEGGVEDEFTGCKVTHLARWSPVGP